MRGLFFFAVLTLAYAKSIEQSETLTAYGSIERVAIPLADEIRKQEEALLKQDALERIIGGSVSALGQIPYQAGVLANYTGTTRMGFCGGSLVSDTKVVYAARCWFDGVNRGIAAEVVLGSTTIFFGGLRQCTDDVVIHPQWETMTGSNDVAVITLKSPVEFSGEEITIQQNLHHLNMSVITNAECRRFYHFSIVHSTLCAQGPYRTSICDGDAGGPVAATRNGQPVLVGIISFGSPFFSCSSGTYPAGCARVTSFLDFIAQHL